MSRLGFKSTVYHGDVFLGELDAIPIKDQNFQFPNNEIRVHHISPQSERCSPLSILQTVSSFSVRCKLESSSPVEQPHLINLHASCFYESKTAVVMNGDEEIHLVAMPSKEKKFPCFWCFAVPLHLYNSSLALLNMRCLSIVFDLDETLIVANTMKSFEDRIDWLRSFIARESDPMRLSGMSAEMKRLMDDRLLLKQYIENDYVLDNGKMLKVQLEEVPALADTQEKLVRPVIRLQERNLVLTRINPEIRDTSVLVRLRPAWEDLRSYLTAKGRKRFEVYVCTMAERDYALEMWRLLDPGSHLISSKELSGRVVCVKSGAKKSLLNVFQDGICHPKMAMVIDDRAKVWEDKDQPRVHVVPAFSPYYAPQAETSHAVPVLCVARNVACNVRAYFFKEFDENLLRRLNDIFYEDDVMNLPSAPDVSNYMMSEEAGFVPNCNGNAPFSDGMNGLEVERRLNQWDEKNVPDSAMHSTTNSPDSRSDISQPHVGVVPNVVGPTSMAPLLASQKPQPSLLGHPIRRDLRNPASGQPPILPRVPVPASISPPTMQPQGGWLVEDDVNQVSQHARPSQESDLLKSDRPRAAANAYGYNKSSPASTSSASHALPAKGVEVLASSDSQKQVPLGNQPTEVGVSQNPVTNSRELQTEAGKSNVTPSHFTIGVLQEIGKKCSSRVEFRTVVSTSKDLQFSVEVLFSGEKIGVGMGKTRKDAQQQAAENALRSLAEKYVSHVGPAARPVDRDFDKLSIGNENGFLWEVVSPESSEGGRDDGLPKEQTPEAAEAEPVSANSSLVNQQSQKHANIPSRSYNTSKRQKEELNGPESLPASRQQKNGNHVL